MRIVSPMQTNPSPTETGRNGQKTTGGWGGRKELLERIALNCQPMKQIWCPLKFEMFYTSDTLSILLLDAPSLTFWAWRQDKAMAEKGSLKIKFILLCQSWDSRKQCFGVCSVK